jgi:hypothetical protein
MSCSNTNPTCLNPCEITALNTAACESVPSQIENFTKQFFGEVVKTEVDGVVTWVLPCDLDIGLENNERAQGEGLACYFLRLFQDGIVGLTGPDGATGAAGQDGAEPFTVTLLSFTQPTLAAPQVVVKGYFNPMFVEGINVFVESSGWYNLDTVGSDGYLYMTLTRALAGAPATITAGKKVIPAGYPGQAGVGTTGPQGPVGATGAPGVAFTSTNGQYNATSGTDDVLANVQTPVTFVNSAPQLLLPSVGTYLLTATVGVKGESGIALNDIVTASLFNTTIAGAVAGSSHKVSNLVDQQRTQIVISVVYSIAGANQTVALYADCTTAAAASVVALNTTMTYVRIG